MYWANKLKKLFGFFWLQVWKDSWLIEFLIQAYQLLLGVNFQKAIQNIYIQTQCTSLFQPDTRKYLKVLIDAQSDSGIIKLQDITIGSSYYIGQTTTTTAYSSISDFKSPDWFQKSVSDDSVKLRPAVDFNYYPDRNQIQFNAPLSQLGFTKQLTNVKGELKVCFQLWAVYEEYNSLRDSFSGILQLPVEWLHKYPGAIQAAWSIRQNGANKRDVIRLLGAIGECPYSTVSGQVHIIDSKTIKIEDCLHKGEGSCLVHQNAWVQPDVKLFSGPDTTTNINRFPYIYTYKDTFPSYITGIHVITDAGVLFAKNQQEVLSGNYLPLRTFDGSTLSSQYVSLCNSRNNQPKIPYAQLSDSGTINPSQFIFKQVWGPSACLVVAPPGNEQDMRIAVDFIVKNVVLGTNIIIYQYNSDTPNSPYLLFPNKELEQELMVYYKTSVNNGTTFKERLKDFNE